MTLRASVFIATSLDGFIARKDGDIDWLMVANTRVPAGEDCGYQAFFDSVDALVMGRNTYELAASFESWPYADKPVVVLSSRPLDIPQALQGSVSCMAGKPKELCLSLAERGYRHVYVDGGLTIQGFLAAGLIDTLIITRIPVLLGEGIPLFGPLHDDLTLRHIETRAFDFGFVQSRYQLRAGDDD
jgi:dihydrofolate reductase